MKQQIVAMTSKWIRSPNYTLVFLCCIVALGINSSSAQNLETLPAPPALSKNAPPSQSNTPNTPHFRAVPNVTVRIKDIVDIEGIRGNKIEGLGLVIGLNGTGGQHPKTRQFAFNLFENMGHRAPPDIRAQIRDDVQFRTDSMSLVHVSAELPAFAYPGQKIDVSVAIMDGATSLQDGKLVLTSLSGIDNKVYALASGPISIGGFGASGNAASVQKNALTQGRIPGGAVVEQTICPFQLGKNGFVKFHLRNADIETATRIANAVNHVYRDTAQVVNQRTVKVAVPRSKNQNDIFRHIAKLQALRVKPDSNARIVIDERSGTIVVGEEVRMSRVGIKYGNLTVTTAETPQVSQPAPFSRGGQTTVVPRTDLRVFEDKNALNIISPTETLVDLANSLNALGVSARELSTILQKVKSAGQLHGELIIE